jgi:hypothetical protein
MKINKSLLVAALGLASVSLASATQYIYYTGSTAARDCVFNTLMSGAGFSAVPSYVGYGNSVDGSCSYMAFSNNVGSTPTIVLCHWSGSEAGISDVSGSGTETFIDTSAAGITAGNAAFPAPGLAHEYVNSGSPSATVSHAVDLCQADNAIAYSKIPLSNASAINDNLAIPFVFVKNGTTVSDQAAFTNITSDNFKCLAQGGEVLMQFTGNAADLHYVYLSGRDSFSGTRVNCFGDTGWGIRKSPNQIILSGGAMVQQSGGSYYTSEGQSSGGTLAGSLTDTTTAADKINPTHGPGFIVVAYLGLSDEVAALNAGCHELTYNGVAYSQANVENGIYGFWGDEWTMVKNGEGSAVTTFASTMASSLPSHTSGYEIPFSAMNVTRNGPLDYPLY